MAGQKIIGHGHGLFSNFLQPKHKDIFKLKKMRKFFVPVFGLIAFQFSNGLPFIICSIILGTMGDTYSLAIFGLGRTFISVFFNSIMTAVTETLGVFSTKFYSKKEYQKCGETFWKTIFNMAFLIFLNYFIAQKSFGLMVAMNIEEELAYSTASFLIQAIPYMILQAINSCFVAFLSSQAITWPFSYLNSGSILLMFISGKYFIHDLQYKHIGFIYAKIIQESFAFVCYVLIMVFQINRETMFFPSFSSFASDFKDYFMSLSKTIVCFYGESLGFELTTYFAALLHDINELALYASYVSFSGLTFLTSCGIANGYRVLIGKYIGRRQFAKAKIIAEQFLVYNFLMCVFFTLLVLCFKYEIGYFYTGDPILSPQMAELIQLWGFIVYSALTYNPMSSICRLLRYDNVLLKVSTIYYPIWVCCIGYFGCFVFGLKVKGIVLGVVIARIFAFLYLFRQLFFRLEWNLDKKEQLLNEK